MTERPSKSRVPALRIVLLVATAVLFTVRFSIGARSRGAETLWDLLLALAIFGILMFFLLALLPTGPGKRPRPSVPRGLTR